MRNKLFIKKEISYIEQFVFLRLLHFGHFLNESACHRG